MNAKHDVLKDEMDAARSALMAVELSQDAIISTDADGNIIRWNGGAECLYGYSAAHAIGNSIEFIFVAAESCPKQLHELSGPLRLECAQIAQSDIELCTEVCISPVRNASGAVAELLWISRDLTQSKMLLDELRRSNKDLQNFAYVASHDLQEPIRAVMGCLQLLEESMESKLSERGQKFFDEATKGALRMQTLVNDLLAYARVQTSASEMKETDLSELSAESINCLERLIEETEAQIVCEKLPTVKIDKSQMRQLFINLIANSIKYRSGEPPQIKISVKRAESKWIFCVEDNGIGFDMQFSEQIFDVFRRLHSRSKYAGSGIGLAICRRIIERHGGTIWAESEPSKGARFYFSLPAHYQRGHLCESTN